MVAVSFPILIWVFSGFIMLILLCLMFLTWGAVAWSQRKYRDQQEIE